MFHETKRDGKVADYDISKISAVIKKDSANNNPLKTAPSHSLY